MRLIEKLKTKLKGAKGMRKNKPKMWRPDQTYNVGDKARYRGKTYECSTANTSSATDVPSSSTNWHVMDASQDERVSAMSAGPSTSQMSDSDKVNTTPTTGQQSELAPQDASLGDNKTSGTVSANTGDIE